MLESGIDLPDPAAVGWESAVVVGLGNPGTDYAGNRHNVGIMAVETIAAREQINLKRGSGKLARVVSGAGRLAGRRVVLATLTTYMNESGQAVRPLLDYYKMHTGALIVVHDELDLPFGVVRIKQGGGAGGHNGLRSITRSLKSEDYTRVRIGIGRPSGEHAPGDFVLRDFSASQRVQLPTVIDSAVHAVTLLIERGLTFAQNVIHSAS